MMQSPATLSPAPSTLRPRSISDASTTSTTSTMSSTLSPPAPAPATLVAVTASVPPPSLISPTLKAFFPCHNKFSEPSRTILHPVYPWVLSVTSGDVVTVRDHALGSFLFQFDARLCEQRRDSLLPSMIRRMAEQTLSSDASPIADPSIETSTDIGNDSNLISFTPIKLGHWHDICFFDYSSFASTLTRHAPPSTTEDGSVSQMKQYCAVTSYIDRFPALILIAFDQGIVTYDYKTKHQSVVLLQTLERGVTSLSLAASDGSPVIAVGGVDGIVRLFRIKYDIDGDGVWQMIGRLGGETGGHSKSVIKVVALGGSHLLSMSLDGTIIEWDIATDNRSVRKSGRYEDSASGLKGLGASPAIGLVALSGNDRSLLLFDLRTFEVTQRTSSNVKHRYHSLDFLPHPRLGSLALLACGSSSRIDLLHKHQFSLPNAAAECFIDLHHFNLHSKISIRIWQMSVHPVFPHLLSCATNIGLFVLDCGMHWYKSPILSIPRSVTDMTCRHTMTSLGFIVHDLQLKEVVSGSDIPHPSSRPLDVPASLSTRSVLALPLDPQKRSPASLYVSSSKSFIGIYMHTSSVLYIIYRQSHPPEIKQVSPVSAGDGGNSADTSLSSVSPPSSYSIVATLSDVTDLAFHSVSDYMAILNKKGMLIIYALSRQRGVIHIDTASTSPVTTSDDGETLHRPNVTALNNKSEGIAIALFNGPVLIVGFAPGRESKLDQNLPFALQDCLKQLCTCSMYDWQSGARVGMTMPMPRDVVYSIDHRFCAFLHPDRGMSIFTMYPKLSILREIDDVIYSAQFINHLLFYCTPNGVSMVSPMVNEGAGIDISSLSFGESSHRIPRLTGTLAVVGLQWWECKRMKQVEPRTLVDVVAKSEPLGPPTLILIDGTMQVRTILISDPTVYSRILASFGYMYAMEIVPPMLHDTLALYVASFFSTAFVSDDVIPSNEGEALIQSLSDVPGISTHLLVQLCLRYQLCSLAHTHLNSLMTCLNNSNHSNHKSIAMLFIELGDMYQEVDRRDIADDCYQKASLLYPMCDRSLLIKDFRNHHKVVYNEQKPLHSSVLSLASDRSDDNINQISKSFVDQGMYAEAMLLLTHGGNLRPGGAIRMSYDDEAKIGGLVATWNSRIDKDRRVKRREKGLKLPSYSMKWRDKTFTVNAPGIFGIGKNATSSIPQLSMPGQSIPAASAFLAPPPPTGGQSRRVVVTPSTGNVVVTGGKIAPKTSGDNWLSTKIGEQTWIPQGLDEKK